LSDTHQPVERSASEPIAVIGMAGRFPGASSLQSFWQNVRSGVDCLTHFSDAELEASGVDAATRAHPSWVARGTVLEDAELFDASFFGYSPREAQIIDPQQRVFLECAWEALEHAGYGAEPPGKAVGVYAGASLNTYVLSQLLGDRALLAAVGGYQLMIGNDKDFLCTRVSYKLDLHGPAMTIQTACSTSLVAVQLACRALQRGECDMALAGGVSINFPQRSGYRYQEGMIFSPDGVCRPFDAAAQGTRAGAGAGVVVLKRLSEAVADRDPISAVILGAAINNDGAGKVGYTAPSVDGQMEVIATAQALARVEPRSISYVEAHGTATPLGDPIEITALTNVFRASTPEREFCALGSLKANLGHLDAAAGVAGLIKTVLALEHAEIPPLAHFRSPNPNLALESSPFRVPTRVEPWASGGPRRAGVSSFGIGGTNAHVVLEQAPPAPASVTHRTHHVLVLSARTPEALATATQNLVRHLGEHPELALADVANTLQQGRRAFSQRRSVVVRGTAEAIAALSSPERPPVLNGAQEGGARPVAFLFSGQGSQHAGMAGELYETEPVFRAAVDRCAERLRPLLDCDLREVLQSGSDAQLSETRLTQPLLFVVEYALATLWMAWGVRPTAMLGHSIGEYVAAHLAGVFSLEDALALVAARGRLMQALPTGAMLAVSLPPAELESRLGPGVEIAAVNAPALCSVSGSLEAIARLARDLVEAGIEHRALHTSHAFHSAMMEPALEPFRAIVARVAFSPPTRRYVSNVTGTWITSEQATSPDYYVAHLRGCVRFADGVAALSADPSALLLEVGPGTALSSLARLTLGRDAAARVVASLPHPREKRAQIESMLGALARLWTAGASVDWQGLHADEQLRRVALPAYPFARQRFWVEASPSTRAAEAPTETTYRREQLDDWFHLPTWARADLGGARRRAVAGTWLILGGNDALTSATVARARALGLSAVVVRAAAAFSDMGDDTYQLRTDSDADYAALFTALRGRPLDGVLQLWSAGETDPSVSASQPLHVLFALARAVVVERPGAALRWVIATSGAQSVLGEAITAPERALLSGPVLVLPVEHPELRVSALDLERDFAPDAAAEALLEEASVDEAEPFVARRAGLRWARRYAEASLASAPPASLPLKPRGVYLITGGTGGIGLTLGEWLASRSSARLVLTSRKAFPPPAAWDAWLAEHPADDAVAEAIQAIRRIESAGGEVMVATADVSDEPKMRAVIDAVQARWGPLDGVIHSAGVAGGSAIAFADVAETDAVVSAKLVGTQVLARLLGTTPLDFFVVFSSISAVIGAAGGAAYASGCAYLDAFVLSTQKPAAWRRTSSIAWDAWRDVGMAPKVVVPAAMRAARAAYVAAGIAPERGAEAFGRILASGLPQLTVSPFEVGRVLGLIRRADAGPARAAAKPAAPTKAAGAPRRPGPIDSPEGEVEQALAAIWEDLLGVQPVGANDNFFELGGHSLLATRILARIDEQFGVRLPLRVVFDAPTLRQLAAQIQPSSSGETPPTGEREEFEL
jgi:acyl transferase domain-containing protein/acyl carrier protein